MFARRRRRDWPSPAEIEATAMLLGEKTLICSCCLGKQRYHGVFGGLRRCGQCNGTGFDIIEKKTREALNIDERGYWRGTPHEDNY
jgi:hypothetical protein